MRESNFFVMPFSVGWRVMTVLYLSRRKMVI
jgi:hypothetical protein